VLLPRQSVHLVFGDSQRLAIVEALFIAALEKE
jgi:hypothetical protein